MKETYDIKNLNPVNWRKYYKKLSKDDPKFLSPNKIYSDHKSYWKHSNWFIALCINKLFYSTVDEVVYNIKTFDDYKRITKKNKNIPLDIKELYGIKIDRLLDKIKLYLKTIYNNKIRSKQKQYTYQIILT